MTGAENKGTALITGASSGLGETFAFELAAAGHDLVLVARRRERLQAIADSLAARHSIKVTVISADLSESHAPVDVMAELGAKGIHIDYLINNAGIAGPDFIEERDWTVQRSYFELMMISYAAFCHAVIPAMLERGWGRIINVSSMAARIPRAGDCNYGPVKAYLIALSESLHATYRHRGVHITALCPGFTHTEFHEANGLTTMKNATPAFIWYGAEVVVREGLRAVERGRPVYASGRLYRWVDPFLQSVWLRPLFRINWRGGTTH